MEEQSTRFICITYQGKQNGSVLLTNKQCMEQLEQTQILPHTKCTCQTANISKIVLTFDWGIGVTIYMFHLFNLPREAQWHSAFNI